MYYYTFFFITDIIVLTILSKNAKVACDGPFTFVLKIVFILDGKVKKVCTLTITKTSHASTAMGCF